jgi:GDP-4-dehydro-6-deoxy-D-mannose reductase
MTRVLITGAGGFIGAHLVAGRAAIPGREIVAVVRRGGPVAAELSDPAQCATLIREQRPDVVIHAAGRAEGSDDDIRRDTETAGRCLLDGVVRHAPQAQVIVFGSAAEYGAPASNRPLAETDPGAPRSAYGRAKLAVTEEAMARTRGRELRATVLRPFNVIGAGVGAHLPLGAFLDRLRRCDPAQRPPVVRMGPLDAVRDFVAVADVVRAVDEVLVRGIAGEIINVCTGAGLSSRQLIARMLALAGTDVTVEVDATMYPAGHPKIIGDPAKCRALLGFAPSADLDAALKAAWMRAMGKAVRTAP